MDTPPGQDPQPFQQQPDAPPTVVSVPGPMETAGAPERLRPDRPDPRRLVAAGLAALAMVLTLSGCFVPLFSTEHRVGGFGDSEKTVFVIVQDAWQSVVVQDAGLPFAVTWMPLGIPLLIAAAILLAATIVSARAANRRRPGSFDRWAVTVAAVFLAGVVAADAMLGIGGQLEASSERETTLEAGIWALFAAVVAAMGAAVLSHRAEEAEIPVSVDASLAELPTPKDGISITVLPPEPQTEAPPDYSAFAPPPDPGRKERD